MIEWDSSVMRPPPYEPRFFLFFSLRKPSPRVTIRSREARAPKSFGLAPLRIWKVSWTVRRSKLS